VFSFVSSPFCGSIAEGGAILRVLYVRKGLDLGW
jgi:hypothetical protein